MVLLGALLPVAHTYNTGPFPAVVCAYYLASVRGRRTAAVAGALMLAAALVLLQAYSPHHVFSWDTAKNLALAALPLVLGVAVHDRRAYTAAILGRAELAERTRDEEARRRVDEERLRIARDVHDVVAHAMVAINVQAGVGAHLLGRQPERAEATLQDIKKVSGEALAELRSVLGVLRAGDTPLTDVSTGPAAGLAGLDALRKDLGSAGVHVDVHIDPQVVALPAPVDAACYRIIQEALTNVMRHVGRTTATVSVTRSPGVVLVRVGDEGSSYPPVLTSTGSGNGVRGMRERATSIGGSFEAGPRTGKGWQVVASLPVEAV